MYPPQLFVAESFNDNVFQLTVSSIMHQHVRMQLYSAARDRFFELSLQIRQNVFFPSSFSSLYCVTFLLIPFSFPVAAKLCRELNGQCETLASGRQDSPLATFERPLPFSFTFFVSRFLSVLVGVVFRVSVFHLVSGC